MPPKNEDILLFIKGKIGSVLFDQVKKSKYDPSKCYIGPEKMTRIRFLKPLAEAARQPYGFDFNLAGWLHDALYEIGGGQTEKDFADSVFLAVMKFIIRATTGFKAALLSIPARIRADEYFLAVHEGGASCFTWRVAK